MHIDRPHSAAEHGFSLIELMIVVAILTIITGAAFALMQRTQESFDRNQLLAEAHQNADFAVVRVTELVRGAGCNPRQISAINEQNLVSNKDYGSSTVNTHLLRMLADLDCDGAVISRVSSSGSQYYILSSEDVTLKYFDVQTTDHSVVVPAHSLCMIDNTPGSNPDQFVPVVLASNIIGFDCTVGSDPRTITLTVTAGPSKNVSPNDPRYVTFTRTCDIRLRNRT
jgi:prepilin-type N-terminal cleavage/methylation domain-containing protein